MNEPTHADIIRFWEGNLRVWDTASVASLRIPQESKDFLTKVGLPGESDWTLTFAPAPKPHPVQEALIILGYDEDVPICVDQEGNSRVVCVESRARSRFVNTSVEKFGHFLMEYEKYRRSVRDMSDDEALALIDRVAASMNQSDPEAVGDPEHYWAVILEQMRDGNL
jgi:hypothetical protein